MLKKIILLLVLGTTFLHCQNEDTFKQGKFLYDNNCAACHMNDGTGFGALIPPLVNSDFLRENNEIVACIIRNGQTDTITVNGILYTEKMDGFKKMTPESMVNIINYINHAWGNDIPFTTLDEVKTALKNCTKN